MAGALDRLDYVVGQLIHRIGVQHQRVDALFLQLRRLGFAADRAGDPPAAREGQSRQRLPGKAQAEAEQMRVGRLHAFAFLLG